MDGLREFASQPPRKMRSAPLTSTWEPNTLDGGFLLRRLVALARGLRGLLLSLFLTLDALLGRRDRLIRNKAALGGLAIDACITQELMI